MKKLFSILKEDWKRIDWKATGRAHWSWITPPIFSGVGGFLGVDAMMAVCLKAGLFESIGFISAEKAISEILLTKVEFGVIAFFAAVLIRALHRGQPDLVFQGDKPSEIR